MRGPPPMGDLYQPALVVAQQEKKKKQKNSQDYDVDRQEKRCVIVQERQIPKWNVAETLAQPQDSRKKIAG